MITAKACGFLYADKGFWGGDENGSILIALVLAIASTKADIYEIGFPAFAGHYYDPDKDVEKNNTAKTNAKKFYDEAVSNYNSIEFTDEFIKNVGNMIHFIQDACEPHHAAGMHNVDAPHLEFESFVNDNLDKLIDPLQGPIHEMHYNKAITTSVDDLVHNAAKEAKVYAGNVGSFLLHINWMETAFYCLQYAIRYTATILYKLSLVAGIPLIK